MNQHDGQGAGDQGRSERVAHEQLASVDAHHGGEQEGEEVPGDRSVNDVGQAVPTKQAEDHSQAHVAEAEERHPGEVPANEPDQEEEGAAEEYAPAAAVAIGCQSHSTSDAKARPAPTPARV